MTRILMFLAATIGGSIGWWLGAFIGFMTAFVFSVVGTAAAVYYARRWSMQYIG
jgi:hypothetical protein